jgi:hypothetical protein
VVCDQLPPRCHGKEGVDGSSPSQGLGKPLQIDGFCIVSVARPGDKGRIRSHAGGTERTDQLSLPYTKEELTGLAESFLRDFPVGEFPYLMEHVPQHVRRPASGQGDYEFGLDPILDGLERMAYR